MKKISDFPDIDSWYIYSKLSKNHFEQGLDPLGFVDKKNEFKDFVLPLTKERINERERKTALIFIGLKICLDKYKPQNSDFDNYLKATLIESYQNKKITQQQVDNFAFDMIYAGRGYFPIVDFMIKNKIVDANVKNKDGYNLLMHTEVKTTIEGLVNLGCDINYKINNPSSSFYNNNLYDLAVKLKRRSLMKSIDSYFLDEEKSRALNILVDKFKSEQNVVEQFKLYKDALKSDNIALIDYIVSHQEHYRTLIKHKDKHGNDIVNHAIKRSNIDVVKKLILLNAIKIYKGSKNSNCYLSEALYKNKVTIAQLLYEENLYDIETVKNALSITNNKFTALVKKLIKDGHTFNLDVHFKHEILPIMENVNTKEISVFLVNNIYLFNLEELEMQDNKIMYNQKRINGQSYFFSNTDLKEITKEKIQILCEILKKHEVLDKTSFDKKFPVILSKIGNNNKDIGMLFTNIFLEVFPDKKNEIIDALSLIEKQPWITQLNMINLEGNLDKCLTKQSSSKFKI